MHMSMDSSQGTEELANVTVRPLSVINSCGNLEKFTWKLANVPIFKKGKKEDLGN